MIAIKRGLENGSKLRALADEDAIGSIEKLGCAMTGSLSELIYCRERNIGRKQQVGRCIRESLVGKN